MKTRTLAIRGTVETASGLPARGARLELVEPSTDQVVAAAVSDDRGVYYLMGSIAARRPTVRLVSRDERILATQRVAFRRRARADFRLSTRNSERFAPVALPLPRLRGRLLAPEAYDLLRVVVRRAEADPERQREYAAVVRRLAPPIQAVPDLLELAWATIDGDPRAMHRYRGALRLAAAARPTPEGELWTPRHRAARRFLPPERLLPVVVAAVSASPSAGGSEELLASLTRGVQGVQLLEGLLEEGLGALRSGDFRRFRSAVYLTGRTTRVRPGEYQDDA